MNILIHTDEYFPTAQACAYRMEAMADAFVDKRNKVTVLTSSSNNTYCSVSQINRKENIIYCYATSIKKKTVLRRLFNNLSFCVSSIIASLKVGPIDVVITTSPPPIVSLSAWIIAKIKHAKLVYDVRDIWPDVAIEMGSFKENSIYGRVFRRITLFMCKHADLITTVSSGKVAKMESYVLKSNSISVDKVILISNGFDRKVLNSSIDKKLIDKYSLNSKFTCVYIGNIGLAQGLDVLLSVANGTKNRDIQFLVFGKGAEKELLEKKVADMKLNNVTFCGVLPHDKVFTILSSAQISFIPLKNSNLKDSIPTKIYESLGVGCPVFLLAEGDSCELVKESKLGIVVSPDCSAEDIIEKFDSMIENYVIYRDYKQYSRELMYNKYSRQEASEHLERLLHNLN